MKSYDQPALIFVCVWCIVGASSAAEDEMLRCCSAEERVYLSRLVTTFSNISDNYDQYDDSFDRVLNEEELRMLSGDYLSDQEKKDHLAKLDAIDVGPDASRTYFTIDPLVENSYKAIGTLIDSFYISNYHSWIAQGLVKEDCEIGMYIVTRQRKLFSSHGITSLAQLLPVPYTHHKQIDRYDRHH